jgi:hypothetical protein
MRTATAEIGFETSANLGARGARILLQYCLRTHDHAGDAVSALCSLLRDK